MYAFNFFAGLLAAAAIGSASPVAMEGSTVEARQTTWTCPNFGRVPAGGDVITPQDSKNGLCCVTGLPYMQDLSRQSCCRNDPALLNHDTYKWSLECSSPWWKSVDQILTLRNCNLDPKKICTDECKSVPYLYPTPRDCPAKA